MKVLYRLIIFFIALQFSFSSFAQQDSCGLHVSLLTCGTGDELYALFGHSALRVTDIEKHTDYVFNYGTFDFDDPNFTVKFAKGNLLYYLAVEDFRDFYYGYSADQRSVQEQILNLSCEEKHKLYNALQQNALPQNRSYLYEFLYDNCSTRLRDIAEKNNNHSFVTKNILPHNNITFRDLLYQYLDGGKQYWNKLGIDILLGANVDKKVSNREATFLPDYLMKSFDSTTINGKPLVAKKRTIFTPVNNEKKASLLTPMMVFVAIFILVGICSLWKHSLAKTFLKIFDPILFFTTGAIGILLIFMWADTNHLECKNNLNLLWAIPMHAVMAFFTGSNKKWVKTYFKLTSWLSLLLLICWIILPQTLNLSLIPMVGVLFLRSQKLSRK